MRFDGDLLEGGFEDADAPAELGVAYWVVGTSPADSDRDLDSVVAGWRAAGCQVRDVPEERPRAGYAETADGLRLAVRQSVQGNLSVFASTPRFRTGPGEGELLPERIDPAG
ncbi:hypothetical protein [Streptomyces sp. TLI_171]|uniref:hypothetical protein n=1 Tax=Streptomyces sp. TLI_171 TaxID=1938859 RepID=UPI000C177C8B|nr:hypothetical protein [Streptomyces sp. TLI_171]RKE23182.1 hypothetical protein BX266_6640 [Streptomyces sp. TLI_171]